MRQNKLKPQNRKRPMRRHKIWIRQSLQIVQEPPQHITELLKTMSDYVLALVLSILLMVMYRKAKYL